MQQSKPQRRRLLKFWGVLQFWGVLPNQRRRGSKEGASSALPFPLRGTSCAIRGARGGDIGRRSPPGSSEELGWAGCGPGGANLAPGPLGSVAGDPDRHRGWLLCPSSVPAAAGRGLRPRVFSAHGPGPQLQVHAPARAVTAHPLAKRLQTGPAFLLQAIFTIWPDLVPIQTDAPA
jgi:hypothetical protein